jgi:hypothetical protein
MNAKISKTMEAALTEALTNDAHMITARTTTLRALAARGLATFDGNGYTLSADGKATARRLAGTTAPAEEPTPAPAPAADNGKFLFAEPVKRGEWHVIAQPSTLRVTLYSLPTMRAARAARDVIAAALPSLPWNADADTLKTAVRDFRADNGDRITDAVMRALAAVPAADPHGWCRQSITSTDTARAEHAAHTAREEAAGYTDTVDVHDVRPGDRISFRYTLTKTRYGFMGMEPIGQGPGSARTVTVRFTVTGEGRVMERHGNNYDEFLNGLRFPFTDGTWTAPDGTTDTILDTAAITTEWGTVRRAPAKPARKTRKPATPTPAAEEPAYTLEITRRVVSTEAEECAYAGEDDHECTGDCLSLDGDVRELETPSTEEITADADDIEAHDGDPVAWAADYIRSKTDVTEPSASPIGDTVREHEWLSGTYTDPYDGAKETLTMVRLTGDWTEEQRAQVFTAATTF